MVLYFSAVIILIIPFDIFYMSSRYYLLWTFWRILFPVQVKGYCYFFSVEDSLTSFNFHLVYHKQAVTFSDFFLADILTSMSKVTQFLYLSSIYV